MPFGSFVAMCSGRSGEEKMVNGSRFMVMG